MYAVKIDNSYYCGKDAFTGRLVFSKYVVYSQLYKDYKSARLFAFEMMLLNGCETEIIRIY